MLKFLGCIITVLMLGAVAGSSVAQGMDSARTNIIKAGMINGFASYTTWPTDNLERPFVIGLMGADKHFVSALERFFKKKSVARGRKIQITTVTIEQVSQCQVLIILGEANNNADEILKAIEQLPVLTISDDEHFTSAGGHVNFFSENNKLRFEVNWKSTVRSKLKVSSRLLRLARLVGEKP